MLDFTATSQEFGKPSEGNDLRLGLATAPVLYAALEFPDLMDLIDRKPSNVTPSDAVALVRRSRGLEKTRQLAHYYALEAERVLDVLPESDAKQSLISLARNLIHRRN
jgi:hexaprenyl-diphosphate synthase